MQKIKSRQSQYYAEKSCIGPKYENLGANGCYLRLLIESFERKVRYHTRLIQVVFSNFDSTYTATTATHFHTPAETFRPRLHCSVFVQKRRGKPPFCERGQTDPHKNATKTEVLENAIKSR